MIYNADLWKIKTKLSFLTQSVFVVPWQGDICFVKASNFLSFCLHDCNHFPSHTDYILFKSLTMKKRKMHLTQEKSYRVGSHMTAGGISLLLEML